MLSKIPLRLVNPYVRDIRRMEIDANKPMDHKISYDRILFYISEGNGFLQIRSSYVPLRPGTFAIINAGEPYNVIVYVGERMSGYSIHFDYTQTHAERSAYYPPVLARQFSKKRLLEDQLPEEFPEISQYICVRSMQKLEEKVWAMLRVFEEQKKFSDSMLSGVLKTVLCELFANFSIQRVMPISQGESIVWNVISYMNSNYMEELTNQSIAAQLNYHPNYLNRQMVQYTGRTLHQHLTACRMSKATELLLFTSVPIANIAANTGFRSASRFSKVFLQKMGCTPSRMRMLYSSASDFDGVEKQNEKEKGEK